MNTTIDAARPLSRGLRVLLYTLPVLTFIAGTQLFVLCEHTRVFCSWAAAPPVGAAFVGAGFWSASAVVLWAEWPHARVILPTIAVVAPMLLAATLEHLGQFHGLVRRRLDRDLRGVRAAARRPGCDPADGAGPRIATAASGCRGRCAGRWPRRR